ncbi:MAG TPA: aconitase X catalytic domain-containing protein [Rhodocyclaceae bacterium]|nr:aconitase X catalytic domain-containing protein [Rhodocyclaceae bacterium]
MKLNAAEQAMLDGDQGIAKQKAMELLLKYGEALGAERLVDTNNVVGTVGTATPFVRDYAAKASGFDAVFSEFNLDSPEVIETPKFSAYTCQVIHGVDTEHWQIQGIAKEVAELQTRGEEYFGKRGINMLATCTPYQVGNVPVLGEHCAWMESSAVVYCNAVLGARTNTEGRESTGAAGITGKIPYWGYHLTENRRGTHLVNIECAVDDMMDWGLLGYHLGEVVQDDVPVLSGITSHPNQIKLKHFGAAAASSGGVEMFHIPGVTPEAQSLEAALGGGTRIETLKYGEAERRRAYEALNSTARDREVDFVMLGCPHSSIEQIWLASRLLEGRRVHENTQLWIFTPRSIKSIADRNGYTKIIADAGAVLMSDTCPAIGRVMPKGTRVVATDSAKQAHYLPAIMGVQMWFGSLADCVDGAVNGRWGGELR